MRIKNMTMYKNSLIYFGMRTSTLRKSRSNSVTYIGIMYLMLLEEGRICGTINNIIPIQKFLVLLPAELLQNLQALDQLSDLGAT